MNYNSDFKYDLELGVLSEHRLSEILHHKRIEVKTDLLTLKTGNVFIEYSSRNKPSGIATTQSDYYAIVIGETIILKTTTELKSIARKYLNTKRDVLGGDNNTSKGVLVPVADLLVIV
jgi:hypothetical protein